ncbi:hypothetical protein EVAR_97188_1 [Eumeta japonica]|uniref:Uncharacterized protein n=1 Tax=Eumeta variegata TaxID=151549 RepID=A0A4C1WJ53_EUMVA|nr:hypothetical protein EVAR_97188_1 [Eumeta japonica]
MAQRARWAAECTYRVTGADAALRVSNRNGAETFIDILAVPRDLVSCHNKTEASRVTVTDPPKSETKLPRSYWSISTRGRHVPLAGPSPFFHVAACYTSASASAPHQFMRIRMQMRMSKLMRMFRMCGCGCEYSQHP